MQNAYDGVGHARTAAENWLQAFWGNEICAGPDMHNARCGVKPAIKATNSNRPLEALSARKKKRRYELPATSNSSVSLEQREDARHRCAAMASRVREVLCHGSLHDEARRGARGSEVAPELLQQRRVQLGGRGRAFGHEPHQEHVVASHQPLPIAQLLRVQRFPAGIHETDQELGGLHPASGPSVVPELLAQRHLGARARGLVELQVLGAPDRLARPVGVLRASGSTCAILAGGAEDRVPGDLEVLRLEGPRAAREAAAQLGP
mmetsp:Transcript_95761/g.274945  ORF Transcript_95761/g.274945 Transcript_95761/m.274945 type:complete len:263 (+) Transcript_95761:315-1103(+)